MKRVLLFITILVLQASQLFAGTTGKLTGKVTDEATGEPLPFVNIILEGTNIGAASDIDGNYIILNISPGKYNVRIQMVGYQAKVIQNVSISIDLTTKLDVTLSEATVELGEIVVQAEMGGLQKDITSSQSLVSSEDIENLPVAEIDDILQLQAGVTRGAGGDFHIRGGRTNEIAYQINGVSVTDAYDNSRGIEIDNSAIQELQVISGTFNAEYGNAMSGIINTVTKEGKSQYHGDIKVYSSDYLSTIDDDVDNKTKFPIFPNVDDFDPVANYNFQGSLSGPIPLAGDKLKFFINGRYTYDDGYLYGQRKFTTSSDTGDGEFVAMDFSRRILGIGNLSYFASSEFKFNIEALYSRNKFKDYNHAFKYNPDGDVTKFTNSLTTTFTMTHTFSPTSFYTLKASYFGKEFEEYLYEDPLDSRYVHQDSLNTVGFAFISGGTNLHQFFRKTKTLLAKLDYTSQVTNNHLLKIGAEFKTHKLEFDDYNLEPKTENGITVVPFQTQIPDEISPNRDLYENKPIEGSVYIQDKIEFDDVIINVGLRFDYFDSRGKVLKDLADPNINLPLRSGLDDLTLAERESHFYNDADPKFQLSPRFGIAYPVSATGVVHFSYGHFLQIPPFEFLFRKGLYKVPTTGGPYGPYGNPDVDPQKTVMYEVGLRQEFYEDYLIDVTAFYRDIRDWITAGPLIETRNGVLYSIYTNKDYSNVKGVTLSLNKRLTNNFSVDVNYTYQVIEGSNSTPEEDFNAQLGNDEPTLFLIPMDWDQRHILNASLYVGEQDWGASLLARYGTGLPYTPAITQFTADRGLTSGFNRNIRRRPTQFTLDLKLHKTFDLFGYDLTAFIRVFNLLDSKVVVNVFDDTGQADFTTEAQNVGDDPNRPNTIEEFMTRPWHYGAPRLVQFGFDFSF